MANALSNADIAPTTQAYLKSMIANTNASTTAASNARLTTVLVKVTL